MSKIIWWRVVLALMIAIWLFSTSHKSCANGACINLCESSNLSNPSKEWSYPQGRTVWEKSDVCTYPRLRVVGEPGQIACLPDNSWWPAVRVTCMVEGKPIPELKNPGTSGWIGASFCHDSVFVPAPLPPILLE